MGAFVYMLRCSDESLYVGCATGEDLMPRIEGHNAGAFPDSYTWSRRPVTLIWSEHFDRITDAIAAERQIKGWNRAKKLALAEGDWARVRQLAKRRGGRPREV
ncbi:MAG TPA: GIY-YIG nuclease family protein [Xanthobacteraceae bacterium]|nr:GIY-YIG nuclease family protein [Xanthobacteraceae bacterium]